MSNVLSKINLHKLCCSSECLFRVKQLHTHNNNLSITYGLQCENCAKKVSITVGKNILRFKKGQTIKIQA